MDKGYIRPNFRIKSDLHTKFKKTCALCEVSMQEMITMWIKRFVEKNGRISK